MQHRTAVRAPVFVMWSRARGFSLHQRQVVIFMGQTALLWAGSCWKGYVGNDVLERCNSGDSHEVILRLCLRLHTPVQNTLQAAGGCLRGKGRNGITPAAQNPRLDSENDGTVF